MMDAVKAGGDRQELHERIRELSMEAGRNVKAEDIYSVLLTISTAGLPVALSKMVSEANTMGRRDQIHKVFHVALCAFLVLGLISFLIMYFGAANLADLMGDSMAADSIRGLSPAVVCVGFSFLFLLALILFKAWLS